MLANACGPCIGQWNRSGDSHMLWLEYFVDGLLAPSDDCVVSPIDKMSRKERRTRLFHLTTEILQEEMIVIHKLMPLLHLLR